MFRGTVAVVSPPLSDKIISLLTGHFSPLLTITSAHIQVSQEFLTFSKSKGNDLMTPSGSSFPGLQPGDKWCLCALRWKEALTAGCAPKVRRVG